MSHRDAMRDNDAKRLCVVCDTWRSVYDTMVVPRPDGTDARVCIACAVTLLRGTHDAMTEQQRAAAWQAAREERRR